MKCARCTAPLDDGALVCGQCGAVVGAKYATPGSSKQSFAPKPAAFPAASLGATPRLVSRVKSLLRSPRKEWPAIAGEPTTAMAIYTGYVMPLAAIGALALFIAAVTIGMPVAFIGVVKAPWMAGLAAALLLFALALAHLFVLTWIVTALAGRFGAQPDALAALKVAAYSYTPIWLAGILFVMPALSVLWLVAGLYSLYLAFVGLPHVMRCPPDRAFHYAILVAVCAFVLSVVFSGLLVALTGVGPQIFD